MAPSPLLSRTLASLILKCEFTPSSNSTTLTDFRLFLYFFLLACAAGVCYFFYNIWILPYFPQQNKRKAGVAKKPIKKIDAAPITSDNEEPAAGLTSSSQAYNADWIPTHHIQRPEARRVKSGGRPKSRGKPE
jgi:hypothetical protein